MKKIISVVFNGKNFYRLITLLVMFGLIITIAVQINNLIVWSKWKFSGGEPESIVGQIVDIVEYYDDNNNLKPILKIETGGSNLELDTSLSKKDMKKIKNINTPVYLEYIPDIFDGDRLTYLRNENNHHVYFISSFQQTGWAAFFIVIIILFNFGLVYLCLLVIFKL